MKYRAIGFTNGEYEDWIIQKKWLGLVWVDVLWLVDPDTYDRLRFSSEDAANKWIERTIELSELRWTPIRKGAA
jgi:hypothetical protein